MIPVLTPAEMAAVDRAAPEPVEVLIERAGRAVAQRALGLLGRSYGARVVVVAGKGHNGDDGRAAARHLERAGVKVTVVDAGEVAAGQPLPAADLVIDAAYGTGIGRAYAAPDPGGAPVLAVDIPSGVQGLTGQVVRPEGARSPGEGPPDHHVTPGPHGVTDPYGVTASATVTFAALKPGHLLGEGPQRCGPVDLADIGLGAGVSGAARTWLVTDADVVAGLPRRPRNAHKWMSALQVVAGSPGMTGAPWLVCRAAMRCSAGYVRLGVPGADAGSLGLPPGELVGLSLPAHGWVDVVLDGLDRFSALVVGPGLGAHSRGPDGRTGADTPVGDLLRQAQVPVVVDADGLNALGSLAAIGQITRDRHHPTVITPHEGEYARLTQDAPSAALGDDRLAAVRAAAEISGATVLLKGSTTVVASPNGAVLLAASGSSRLASAGTGDVLSGVIGAFLARGLQPAEAAAFGAHVHGRAAGQGLAEGLVASDLPELMATWLSSRSSEASRSSEPVLGDRQGAVERVIGA
jgi:NAD(P)H-hydrate epimerase